MYVEDIKSIENDLNIRKGQIFALELLEDLKSFLEEEEELDEEIQTSR